MVGALALGFDSGRAEQKKMVVNISFTEEKLRIKPDYKNIIDVPHPYSWNLQQKSYFTSSWAVG